MGRGLGSPLHQTCKRCQEPHQTAHPQLCGDPRAQQPSLGVSPFSLHKSLKYRGSRAGLRERLAGVLSLGHLACGGGRRRKRSGWPRLTNSASTSATAESICPKLIVEALKSPCGHPGPSSGFREIRSDSHFPTKFSRPFPPIPTCWSWWEVSGTGSGRFAPGQTTSTTKVRRVDFGDCDPRNHERRASVPSWANCHSSKLPS